MGTQIDYNDDILANLSNDTLVLQTGGKYVPGNITIQSVSGESISVDNVNDKEIFSIAQILNGVSLGTLQSGYIDANGDVVANSSWQHTNYLEVTGGNILAHSGITHAGSNTNACCAFYIADANTYTVIQNASEVIHNSSSTTDSNLFIIPDKATHVRFSVPSNDIEAETLGLAEIFRTKKQFNLRLEDIENVRDEINTWLVPSSNILNVPLGAYSINSQNKDTHVWGQGTGDPEIQDNAVNNLGTAKRFAVKSNTTYIIQLSGVSLFPPYLLWNCKDENNSLLDTENFFYDETNSRQYLLRRTPPTGLDYFIITTPENATSMTLSFYRGGMGGNNPGVTVSVVEGSNIKPYEPPYVAANVADGSITKYKLDEDLQNILTPSNNICNVPIQPGYSLNSAGNIGTVSVRRSIGTLNYFSVKGNTTYTAQIFNGSVAPTHIYCNWRDANGELCGTDRYLSGYQFYRGDMNGHYYFTLTTPDDATQMAISFYNNQGETDDFLNMIFTVVEGSDTRPYEPPYVVAKVADGSISKYKLDEDLQSILTPSKNICNVPVEIDYGLSGTDGTIIHSSPVNINFGTADYFSVEGNTTYTVQLFNSTTVPTWIYYNWRDANGELCGTDRYYTNGSTQYQFCREQGSYSFTLTTPNDATQMAISFYKSGGFNTDDIPNMVISVVKGSDTRPYEPPTYAVTNIADNIVTESKLADNAVTENKLAIGTAIGGSVAEAFRHYPVYDHCFVTGSITVPHESAAHIRMSRRFGYKIIEGNVHTTADGKFIVNHTDSGKLGTYFEHVDGTTDVSQWVVSNYTYAQLEQSVRYASLYPRYKTPPILLEQFLSECLQQDLIPFVTSDDDDAIDIIEAYMGVGNFIYYTTSPVTLRAKRPRAVLYQWTTLTTKDEIVSYCESVGRPFIYGMSNPSYFSDEQLRDIVGELHRRGFWVGTSYKDTDWPHLRAIGFDLNGAQRLTNRVTHPDVLRCTSYENFYFDPSVTNRPQAFTITGATETDDGLYFENGGTILPKVLESNPYYYLENNTTPSIVRGLYTVDVSIRFNGTVDFPTIGILGGRTGVTSDGSEEVFISSPCTPGFRPVQTLTIGSDTTVYDVSYLIASA